MAAKPLIERGHRVVLHARDQECAEHTPGWNVPGAEAIVTGDLAGIAQMRSV